MITPADVWLLTKYLLAGAVLDDDTATMRRLVDDIDRRWPSLSLRKDPMTGNFVDQTILHDENGTVPGNCWQACIATLLDLPLAEVPHFVHLCGEDWATATERFVQLKKPGLTLGFFVDESYAGGLESSFPVYQHPDSPPYAIATGPSPRGDFLHSVIVDSTTGLLVHDPHPSRAGLAGPFVDVAALVSIDDDPAEV